jgi:type I restriction enzyme S subunit
MGKISYSDHVKKSDLSVVIAEIIFQSLKKTHKLLPLFEVVNTSSGGTPSRTNHSYYGGEIPWLKSGEMNDSLITHAEEFITEEGLKNSSAKVFAKGTLLVAMYGATAGKTGILNIDASTNQAVCAVTPKDKNTNRDFLFWFFRANRFYFIDISRGGAQPNISQSVIGNTDFPILEEGLQKNIALFLSNLEQTKEADYCLIPSYLCKPVKLTFDYLSCLQNLEGENKKQANIVSQLKQAILQEAIAGQLTAEWRTQNPMQKGNPDTDAAALLAKIKAEKEQLIADGKLKKEKPLPEISPDEIPFSLPYNWVWCRVQNLAEMITSGSRSWAKYYSDSGAIFVTMSNLSRGSYNLRMENIRYVNPPPDSEGARAKLEQDDLLISITGDVGNLGLIPDNFGEAYINQHTSLLRFMPDCRNRYFPEFMRSPLAKKQFEAPQRGIKNSFRLGDLGIMIIPLPPLAEQKAIAEKVDRLMETIDQLEQQIKHRKELAEDLMQTVLREAFE